jgi:hypothetical protein
MIENFPKFASISDMQHVKSRRQKMKSIENACLSPKFLVQKCVTKITTFFTQSRGVEGPLLNYSHLN